MSPSSIPTRRAASSWSSLSTEGEREGLALFAGQSNGLTDEVRPGAAVLKVLVAEAEARIEHLSGLTAWRGRRLTSIRERTE